MPESAPWLTPFSLDEGQAATFRIGSFALQVHRRAREWRVLTATSADLAAVDVDTKVPDPEPGPLPFEVAAARPMRFVFEDGEDALRLRPRLADRPVVVRPADALYLLPGASVEVFVSTIVWVVLEHVRSGVVLLDLPALRPSDTWFGPSTRDGELAYASRTSARLDARDLPARPHRATTCIRLENTGSAPRSLAKVMLPAPSLELWQMPTGMLWTQTVELTLGDGEESPLRFRPGPPEVAGTGASSAGPDAPAPVRVAGARRLMQRSLLVRAMSAIF
jgi:hypothetical protein